MVSRATQFTCMPLRSNVQPTSKARRSDKNQLSSAMAFSTDRLPLGECLFNRNVIIKVVGLQYLSRIVRGSARVTTDRKWLTRQCLTVLNPDMVSHLVHIGFCIRTTAWIQDYPSDLRRLEPLIFTEEQLAHTLNRTTLRRALLRNLHDGSSVAPRTEFGTTGCNML